MGVKADETDSMRVSIMAYDSNKDTFKFKYFIFHDKYEFRNAQTILTNFNKLCFESSKRLLWVFVNPVSGSGLSRDYYNKILLPVLEFTGINHEMFETSPKFFDTFFENLNIDEQKYTDFVVVGGDGLFGQLLNSVMAHKDKSKLMKLSFGFMPGGSCNALSCALGSKNPYLAAIQIARGITVKSDMFRIDMTDKGTSIYSTAFTYGFPTDLMRESEGLRSIFGKYRYIAWGFKKFVTNLFSPNYQSDVYYKTKFDQNNTNEIQTESQSIRSGHANVPRVNSYKSKLSIMEMYESYDWEKLPEDNFWFYAIVTHEVRSSINDEIFAPFARINDNKMYIAGLKSSSKIEALTYLTRVSNGTHLDFERYFFVEVSSLKIKNPPGSYFWVDGEPHESSEYTVTLLPSSLNLIGKVGTLPITHNKRLHI